VAQINWGYLSVGIYFELEMSKFQALVLLEKSYSSVTIRASTHLNDKLRLS
jgi:hypothetical protein